MDRSKLTDDDIGSVVRLARRHGDVLHGVVAALGRRWVIVHVLHDLELDGLAAVRRRDLMEVGADRSSDNIIRRVLDARSQFPASVSGATLDDTAATLAFLGRSGATTVTVHPEARRPGTCHLGRVTRIDRERKRFDLLEMSPDASWDDEPTRWRFKDVTQISIGSNYSNGLDLVAEPVELHT